MRRTFPWDPIKCFNSTYQKLAGGGGLHHLDNSVVDGILVLLEPASDVVGHDAGVVGDGEVGVLVSLGLGLEEDGQLSKGGLQFFLKRLIGRFWEERLLLKDGPDAHGLLEHDDGGGQVHAEVHHHPVNTLSDVLLLLDNKPVNII